MKQRDIEAVEKLLTEAKLPSVGRGLLLSPSSQEIALVMRMFPEWTFDVLERKDWDLMTRYEKDDIYNIAIMCNMFMYSKDPGTWLNNLSENVDMLIVQDAIRCPRMPDSELGSDDDSFRYAFPSHGEYPRLDEYFDMEKALGDRIVKVIFYSDDGNGDRDCRKFVAAFDVS
jgi:hypothetical protein